MLQTTGSGVLGVAKMRLISVMALVLTMMKLPFVCGISFTITWNQM
ncbi:MAG: hypothetical protein Q8Q10_01535 [bacterium]|nr:hypothetical protein [bacterium]